MRHERLKRWMKKHPQYTQVLALGWSNLDGAVDCDPHDMRSQEVWLGLHFEDDGFVHGASIKRILSGVNKSTEGWALPVRDKKPVDITDWFWSEYERKGVCLLSDHAHDLARINANATKCRRCGQHFTREVRTRRQYKRIEIWSPA